MAGEKWIDAFFGYTQGLKKPVMYLVNAFVDPNPKSVAGPRFSGNPAAVCLCSRLLMFQSSHGSNQTHCEIGTLVRIV
jgi:hypothetical protein